MALRGRTRPLRVGLQHLEQRILGVAYRVLAPCARCVRLAASLLRLRDGVEELHHAPADAAAAIGTVRHAASPAKWRTRRLAHRHRSPSAVTILQGHNQRQQAHQGCAAEREER